MIYKNFKYKSAAILLTIILIDSAKVYPLISSTPITRIY